MKFTDETIAAIDESPIPDRNASIRLANLITTILICLCAFFVFRTGGDVTARVAIGLGILALAFYPAIQWTRSNRTWFPAFELFCLSSAAFYGLPLLLEHSTLNDFSDDVVTRSGLYVLAFQACAVVGFSIERHKPRTPSWSSASLLPEFAYRYIPFGVLAHTLYLYLEGFTDVIPYAYEGPLRALFFGLGTLCTFVMAKLWGLRALPNQTASLFVFNLIIQLILQFSHLYLIGGISLLALALISFASARRTVPWLIIILVVPSLAILHGGKSQMRSIYWSGGQSSPTLTELPGFFADWIDYGLNPVEAAETLEEKKRTSIFERASLIQMLCLTVDRVPDVKPFLNGESYVDIPAQVIPRFVWPDKPSSLLANVRLAIHFDLVDPDDAMSVSIAFGMIAEAYCNFGGAGVVLLGVIIGLIFRQVSMLSLNTAQFSALGILMILLTAWSFQAELILATWLASLFQASAVCIGAPLIYRQFTTR
jgi:hypothetical protein